MEFAHAKLVVMPYPAHVEVVMLEKKVAALAGANVTKVTNAVRRARFLSLREAARFITILLHLNQ